MLAPLFQSMEYSVDLLIISMSKEKEGVKLRSAGDASIFSVCSGVPPNVPPALTSRSPRRRAVDGFHRWPGTRSGAAGEKIPVSKTMGLKCKPGNVRSRTSAAAISCNRTAISIISAATTTGATRVRYTSHSDTYQCSSLCHLYPLPHLHAQHHPEI